ncbi:hypothetical protein SO694_00044260 [Aureococcus anophagefferens]|uniref:Uncharacterized protein n=1 Tax=Aureococcus anophagefferens TaxID=44056 RepID=A0ABR1G7N2_AURAN
MRYEVVARKGLLLREGYATDSDKVCEARKGSFVVALGPQRDVGGVCRLEVVTPEGLRGWCSLKAQLLAPRDDAASSRAPRRPWPSSSSPALSSAAPAAPPIEQLMFMGGERGAAGARAARGLVAIASSASGFEVASSRPKRRPGLPVALLDGRLGPLRPGPARGGLRGQVARRTSSATSSRRSSRRPCAASLTAERSSASARLGLGDPDDEAPILLHARGNAGLRTYAKLLERLRRSPHAKAAATQRERARFGDDFPSGPRQGRVPGIPSLFLVPAGDPS